MATRYPEEFRRRAVELARLRTKPILHVAQELGISDATLHGWLKQARVYVVVDDAHTTAVARILAPTGATYIQLDPGKPIPQRKERLDAYMESKGK